MENIGSIAKSTIDNRQVNKLKQSTIDYQLSELQTMLSDKDLGKGLVATALSVLGEYQVRSIANYAIRKGNHPGKLFVSICNKAIKEKTEQD